MHVLYFKTVMPSDVTVVVFLIEKAGSLQVVYTNWWRGNGVIPLATLDSGSDRTIEYTRAALACTVPPVWLELYLVKFLIKNLSYSPCMYSEPSHTVIFLNVMYTMYAATRLKTFPPPLPSILLFLHGLDSQVDLS